MTQIGWGVVITLSALLAAALAVLIVARRRLAQTRQHARDLARQIREQAWADAPLPPLDVLASSAYNALILVDAERRILHFNDAARDLFGEPPPESTLIAAVRQHELDDLAGQSLAREERIEQQIAVRGHPYRARALPIESAGRRYVAIALEDVSELARLGRARRDMVANISHELRTPITTLRVLLDTLRREDGDARQRRALVQKMAAQTDALQQMAQELLDLAMIESGRAEMILRPVSLAEIAQSVIGQFAEQAERAGVTLESAIGHDVRALADSDQIGRALGNLIHNAVKFTPSGGHVKVCAEERGQWVEIGVTDSGPGIPQSERERVFERFYRTDRARGKGGTGLGLAIARHIVAAHGGTIRAEAGPGGVGARLVFTLNRSDES